ncbi:MAG: hypothetical protein ACK515_01740, partial [bacterium]
AGKAGAALAGVLSDVNNKANLFNRTYPGGSVRAQAHALADDVVQAGTGRDALPDLSGHKFLHLAMLLFRAFVKGPPLHPYACVKRSSPDRVSQISMAKSLRSASVENPPNRRDDAGAMPST